MQPQPMSDILDRADPRPHPDAWHPSKGAPPGLRAANTPTRSRVPVETSVPDVRGWHPSVVTPDTRSDHSAHPPPTAEPEPQRVPKQTRVRNARPGPPPRRALLLIIATAIALVTLAGRLAWVQWLDRDTYVDLGVRQGTADRQIPSVRGAILDRNLNLLAVSDNRPTVWADPRSVRQPHQTASVLATVLDIDPDVVAERLASDRHFVYVARQVSPSQGAAVQDLQLPGISVRAESSRLRPNGDNFARGLLGAVDIDQNPLGGAEKQFADVLNGTDGRQVARIAQSGMPLPNGVELFEPVSHGDDVVLTLHTQMQWVAERSLTEAVESTGARSAMAVVLATEVGDVLALAAVRRDSQTGQVRPVAYNPAYTDAFEPGSVAKSFTIATALDAGLTTPESLHFTPARYVFADKRFIEPYSNVDREMTTTEVLVHSSNIGTIQIAESIGATALHRSLRSFGFGSLTGADGSTALPGESRGILRPANAWQGTDLATIAFGQGMAVTAVQLAAAYNTIANDGIYVTPRLVLGSVGSDGVLRPADPARTHRVLSSATAERMAEMLSSVVSDGTGQRAAISGYRVAGKTGTAQKPDPQGGYSDTNYVSSFAGFLPAGRPELTVVVVLDEPDEPLAGIVAAPLFAEIAEYALRMLQVSPDD